MVDTTSVAQARRAERELRQAWARRNELASQLKTADPRAKREIEIDLAEAEKAIRRMSVGRAN